MRTAASATGRPDGAAAAPAGSETTVKKHVNQACLVLVVRRGVGVCMGRHVTTSLESVTVHQGGEESSVTKRVCRVPMGRAAFSAAAALRARPATTSQGNVDVLLDSLETAANRLVSQEPLGRTVTRSVSVQRRTSSATRCPDRVTAPQVSEAPNVTKSVGRVDTDPTVNGSVSVKTEANASLPPAPVNVRQGL